MLISQLYRTNSLSDKGYELLQNWYKLTNDQKHEQMLWLADQLRAGIDGKKIQAGLAARLKVNWP